MTYEQYSPEWLIAHCDVESAFERAVSRQMDRLLAENSDFRATIDHLTRENAGQLGEIVALKEQRDELLGALRQIQNLPAHPMRKKAVEIAVVAIAKAGGAA